MKQILYILIKITYQHVCLFLLPLLKIGIKKKLFYKTSFINISITLLIIINEKQDIFNI